MNLIEKHRPRRLADLLGQDWVVHNLEKFLAAPYSTAFLFEGATGTGKTSAAILVAEALGVAVDEGPFGGFYQIASGEQTGESVRDAAGALHCRPFLGSGWRVLVVNEADAMTPNAAYVWLDVLENLPPKTVIIFTTNRADRLPRRLRDRCESLHFESGGLILVPAARELAARLWAAEVGGELPVPLEHFGPLADEEGNVSFRRLVQLMTPYLRAGMVLPRQVEAQVDAARTRRSAAARKGWETRRRKAAKK